MCRGLRGLRVCRWLRAKFVGCAAAPKDDIEIPAQGGGLRVAHVAGSVKHFLLLRSDGTAVACGGDDKYGELSILALEGGCDVYTSGRVQVQCHTVLLRSDGKAVAGLPAFLPGLLACLLALPSLSVGLSCPASRFQLNVD